MANLKEKYNQELRPALKEELGLSNIMAVPILWMYQYYDSTNTMTVPILWLYQYNDWTNTMTGPILWLV